MHELGKDSAACRKLILLEKAVTSEIVLCILIADSLFSYPLVLCPCLPLQFSICSLPSTVPSSSVLLSTSQQGSDVLLTWGEIPLVNHRGFLLGYNIYNSTGSDLKLLGTCYDVKCHLCKQYSCSSSWLEKGLVCKTSIIHVITSFIAIFFGKCIFYPVKLINFPLHCSSFSFLPGPLSLCSPPCPFEQPICQTKKAGATQ